MLIYSQKVYKTGSFKERSSINSWESTNWSESSFENQSIQRDNSIISSTINGKTSKKVSCLNWNHNYPSSEEEFTSLLLHIPSKREITVYLKYYPKEPIDGKIMIDYEVKFERYITEL